jgi:hypothetical protein
MIEFVRGAVSVTITRLVDPFAAMLRKLCSRRCAAFYRSLNSGCKATTQPLAHAETQSTSRGLLLPFHHTRPESIILSWSGPGSPNLRVRKAVGQAVGCFDVGRNRHQSTAQAKGCAPARRRRLRYLVPTGRPHCVSACRGTGSAKSLSVPSMGGRKRHRSRGEQYVVLVSGPLVATA